MSAAAPPLPPQPGGGVTAAVGLNGALNSFGLDWHYSDVGQPNLVYTLQAVDGVSVSQTKTLLNISLTSPSNPPPLPSSTPFSSPASSAAASSGSAPPSSSTAKAAIELVEKEVVQRSIPLHRLISCEPSMSDPHTLQLVHLTDAHSRQQRKDKPQSTCAVLSLTFPSLEDAQDVATTVKACIHCASSSASTLSSSPSSSPLLSKTLHGQLCIHQGWVEKKSSTSLSYAKRFMRLFPNRLLLYRSPTAPYPVNVFPLTVDDLDTHALITAPKPRIVEVNMRHMWGVDGREGLLWRTATSEEQHKWVNAIAMEQTASFRTRVGAILTPALRAALAAPPPGAVDEAATTGRRGSGTGAPPLPPLPHPALTAVALSITAAAAAKPTGTSSPRSTSPHISRQTSMSTSFAGNPLLDLSTGSPSPSPPLGAALFATAGTGQLPMLHLGASTSPQSPPLSLSSLLGSPHSFFHYLLHLSSLPLLFPTSLPSPAAWLRLTPQPFLKKRGKLMLSIDAALLSHHALLAATSLLWSESRLVMVDELEQSGSGQIGFSFPGFDAQVFDVGKLSVIACHQLLSTLPHALLFTRRDYEQAIESSSPAKEMMQSSPDIAALFDAGQMDEARQLSHEAQRLVLHHCALAAHVKSRTSNSGRHSLKANEVIPWSAVLHTAIPQGGTTSRNQAILESDVATAYIANPSLHTLQLLLSHHSSDVAAPTPVHVARWDAPFNSAPVSPQGSPNGSPTSMPSTPKHGKRRIAQLWHARRGSETHGKSSQDGGRNRAGSHHAQPSKSSVNLRPSTKPTSKLTQRTPPSGSSTSTPTQSPSSLSPLGSVMGSSATVLPASALSTSLNLALPEDVTDVRPLVNPLHLLLLLRCLLLSRLQSVQAIEAACQEWWRKRREERGLDEQASAEEAQKTADKGDRMDNVGSLMRKLEDEHNKVSNTLAVLPDYEELERQRDLQDREDRDTIARNAIIKRRIAESKAREDARKAEEVVGEAAAQSARRKLDLECMRECYDEKQAAEAADAEVVVRVADDGRERDGSGSSVLSEGSDVDVPPLPVSSVRVGIVRNRLANFEQRLSAGGVGVAAAR